MKNKNIEREGMFLRLFGLKNIFFGPQIVFVVVDMCRKEMTLGKRDVSRKLRGETCKWVVSKSERGSGMKKRGMRLKFNILEGLFK